MWFLRWGGRYPNREVELAKKIRCADVGLDCDYEGWAETEEELLKMVADHAHQAHGIEEVTPELEQKLLGAMRDA